MDDVFSYSVGQRVGHRLGPVYGTVMGLDIKLMYVQWDDTDGWFGYNHQESVDLIRFLTELELLIFG